MQASNMVRKQVMMLPEHVKKIKVLAKKQKTSASDIVRRAVDAFDPDALGGMDESELLELAHAKVREAITDTIQTREKVMAALDKLEARRVR